MTTHSEEREALAVLENVTDAVAVVAKDGRFIYLNAASEQLTGRPPQEMLGKIIWEVFPPSSRSHLEQQSRQAMTTQKPVKFELLSITLPGWLEVRIFPAPQNLTFFFRDITEEKKTLDQLHQSEDRLRFVIAHAPAAIAMFDSQMRYLMVSNRWLLDYHLEGQNLLGRSHYEVFPEIPDRWKQIHQRCLAGTSAHCDADPFVRADGSTQWVRWEIQPWYQADDTPKGIVMLTEDITHRVEAAEALQASEERFRSLFNTMAEGFALCEIICDKQGKPVDFRYLQVNPAFESHTGLKPEQVTGKRALEVIPNLEPQWIEVYGKVALTGEPARYESHVQAMDRDFEVFAFSPAKGQFAVVFVEISERVKARKIMQQAKDEAEQANKTKDHFLAVLSHELRTPLTPILAATQLMEEDAALSPDLLESVRMIRRNTELEARLIDDLLDFTKINRDKLGLHIAPVDLHERLKHVLAMCHDEITAKALVVTVETQARQHHVAADSARLQQILWNVLKNAVKFTPAGGRITIRSDNPTVEQISVVVQDTGMGIEPSLLSRLFNAFEQGGSDITRQFGGLGLGLAISKGLVDLHGGTLVADSDGQGKGAKFTLTLPITSDTNTLQAPADVHAPIRTLAVSRQVLLVEDHPDTARVMSNLLSSYGFTVVLARNVAEAMAAGRSNAFDLLVSDIGLPDGSGLDLLRYFAATKPIKAIALSGYGMEEDIRKSKEAGFLAHLTKPVDLEALERVLAKILDDPAVAAPR